MVIRIPWTCAFLFFSLGLVATTLNYDSWGNAFVSSAYYHRKLVTPHILWRIMLPLLGVIPGIPVLFDFVYIFTRPTAKGPKDTTKGAIAQQKKIADFLTFTLLILLTAYVLVSVNPIERRMGEIYNRNPTIEIEKEMESLAPQLFLAHKVLFSATSLAIILQIWSANAGYSAAKKD
eukprot:TRINITY_DN320_c0_g1_i1.p1 TRINITY_DN320_c0_g1~~TRINITY_DN320_c0_g1_i1.p1  ORF type:complete len:177 (-),score=40.75 TRINITY_DN320_c0_g1_i1:196-726(-)